MSGDILEQDWKIRIINVYGPNAEAVNFYQSMVNKEYEECDKLVFVGDFNVVLNHQLDRNTDAKPINSKTSEKLNQICKQLHLQDIWRIRNPNTRRYSWYRKSSKTSE